MVVVMVRYLTVHSCLRVAEVVCSSNMELVEAV